MWLYPVKYFTCISTTQYGLQNIWKISSKWTLYKLLLIIMHGKDIRYAYPMYTFLRFSNVKKKKITTNGYNTYVFCTIAS